MKTALKCAVTVITLLALPGCAFFYSLDKDLDQQVDKWLEQREYTQALDALDLVRPNHPKYKLLQKKKQQVIKEAEQYEKTSLKKVNELVARQEWDPAEKILNESMEKLPDSESIQQAYAEFIRLRANHLKSLYYKLYINKAEWLVKNKDINQELERALPKNRESLNAIREHKNEIQHVYQQLLVCGIEAMNINDLDLAEQCYLLAYELKPSDEIKSTLTNVQQQLSRLEKHKTTVLSKRARHYLEESKTAMQAGKLKQALELYNEIPATEKRHGLVKSYKQELDKRISNNVNDGIEVGRKLYSQGQVEQALAIWNELLALAPDNEYLISHIERAKRVQDKLLKLRKKDNSEVPQGIN